MVGAAARWRCGSCKPAVNLTVTSRCLFKHPRRAPPQGLTHGYPGRPLFKNCNLEITKGDRVAIIGPNGAGEVLSSGAMYAGPGSRG